MIGFFLAIVIAIAGTIIGLAMWVGVAKLAYKITEDKGLLFVLLNFLLAVVSVFLVYYQMFVAAPCHGFLCRLDTIPQFSFFGAVIVLAWPSILLIYYRFKEQKNEKSQND